MDEGAYSKGVADRRGSGLGRNPSVLADQESSILSDPTDVTEDEDLLLYDLMCAGSVRDSSNR